MPDGFQFIGARARAKEACIKIDTGAIVRAAARCGINRQPIGAGYIDNLFVGLTLSVDSTFDHLYPLQGRITRVACRPEKKPGEACFVASGYSTPPIGTPLLFPLSFRRRAKHLGVMRSTLVKEDFKHCEANGSDQ